MSKRLEKKKSGFQIIKLRQKIDAKDYLGKFKKKRFGLKAKNVDPVALVGKRISKIACLGETIVTTVHAQGVVERIIAMIPEPAEEK